MTEATFLPRLGQYYMPPAAQHKRFVHLVTTNWRRITATPQVWQANLSITGVGLQFIGVRFEVKRGKVIGVEFPKRKTNAGAHEPVARFASTGDEGEFYSAVNESRQAYKDGRQDQEPTGELQYVGLAVNNLLRTNNKKLLGADYLLIGTGLMLNSFPIWVKAGKIESFGLPYCKRRRQQLVMYTDEHAETTFQTAACSAIQQYLYTRGIHWDNFIHAESKTTVTHSQLPPNQPLDIMKRANPHRRIPMAERLASKVDPRIMALTVSGSPEALPTL